MKQELLEVIKKKEPEPEICKEPNNVEMSVTTEASSVGISVSKE